MSNFPLSDSLAVSRALIGVSTLISIAEYAALSHQLVESRLLSWNVGQLRYRSTLGGRLEKLARLIFGPTGTAAQLAVRAFAAVVLLVPNQNPIWGLIGSAVIAATTLSWSVRSPQGQDGSDQVLFWLACSLSIGYAVNTPVTWATVTLFVAAQLTICYLTAGFTKLVSVEWRSGVAVPYVFRTFTYGSGLIYRFISQNRVAQLSIAWFVIGFEILFPAIFLFPPELGQYLLLVPLGFHLATALFMGLNLFFLNFLAAYPFAFILIWADFSTKGAFMGSFST